MVLTKFQLESVGLSDIGHVRDENEDIFSMQNGLGLFLLADGMGGRSAGKVAAERAVATLQECMAQHNTERELSAEEGVERLREAYRISNETVFNLGQTEEKFRGMGTTLSVLLFLNQQAIISHIGDSRIYLMRKNKLSQMTEDHTLINEYLHSASPGSTPPGKHILSKAVGPYPVVEPSIELCPYIMGDLFLICSDGLSNSLNNREIEEILRDSGTTAERADRLMREALVHGGKDNVTFILVKVRDDLSG